MNPDDPERPSEGSMPAFAFLNHSQSTLPNYLPPEGQQRRRKRTRFVGLDAVHRVCSRVPFQRVSCTTRLHLTLPKQSLVSHSLFPLLTNLYIKISPEDQAILESEFQKNPKPAKAARMAIVERVNMGEKEVQVSIRPA